MKIKAKKCTAPKVVVKKPAACAAKKCAAKAAKKDVTFTFHAEKGHEIYLAGNFNGWDPVAKKLAFKARQGLYTATLKLEAGRYEYKFVVDGTWTLDPQNTALVHNDMGTDNSVIDVK